MQQGPGRSGPPKNFQPFKLSNFSVDVQLLNQCLLNSLSFFHFLYISSICDMCSAICSLVILLRCSSFRGCISCGNFQSLEVAHQVECLREACSDRTGSRCRRGGVGEIGGLDAHEASFSYSRPLSQYRNKYTDSIFQGSRSSSFLQLRVVAKDRAPVLATPPLGRS